MTDELTKRGEDYTPDTETVRSWYVKGIRNAFVGSTGQHLAEFDRWLERHDAEKDARIRGAAIDLDEQTRRADDAEAALRRIEETIAAPVRVLLPMDLDEARRLMGVLPDAGRLMYLPETSIVPTVLASESGDVTAAIDIVDQARQYAAAACAEPFGMDDPGLDRNTAAAWVERLAAEVERLRAEREALHSDETRGRLRQALTRSLYLEFYDAPRNLEAVIDAVLSVLTADPEADRG